MGSCGKSTRFFRRLRPTGDEPEQKQDCCLNATFARQIQQRNCADPENLGLLKDRGWVVLRKLLPIALVEEISQQTREAIQQPLLYHCGCSDGEDCMGAPEGCKIEPWQMRKLFPKLVRIFRQLFASWEATNIADDAELGVNLRAQQANRISVTSPKRYGALLRQFGSDKVRPYHQKPGNPWIGAWHADGSVDDGSAVAHKHALWIVIEKSTDEHDRKYSNLGILPFSSAHQCGLQCQSNYNFDDNDQRRYSQLGCFPVLDPIGIWHMIIYLFFIYTICNIQLYTVYQRRSHNREKSKKHCACWGWAGARGTGNVLGVGGLYISYIHIPVVRRPETRFEQSFVTAFL